MIGCIYFVAGIWNSEGGLLVESLRTAGFITIQGAHEYLQKFIFPSQWKSRSITGQDLLKKHVEGELRCSASEGLCVYSIFRFLLMEIFPPGAPAPPAVQLAVDSYFALCRALDLLQRMKATQDVDPTEMERAIVGHLTRRQLAYGKRCYTPKCHYSLHLARFMRKQNRVLSCWVHERKHRSIKRYADAYQNANNTTAFERGLLQQTLLNQCQSLKDFAVPESVSLGPSTIAAERLSHEVRSVAGLGRRFDLPVEVSKRGFVGPVAFAAADIALALIDSVEAVGEIWFHAHVAGRYVTCFSPWESASAPNQFMMRDAPKFIPMSSLKRPCIYRKDDIERVSVVP